MRRPAPRKLSLEQAYEAAYLWLFHIDQAPTEVVEKPPEMVELYTEHLVAWVRASSEVKQKAILAFLQQDDERDMVIFSSHGFSPGAISISESQGVALFTLLPDGSVRPETGHAIMMMPTQPPPAPFDVPDIEDEDEVLGMSSWGTTYFDSTVWVDCPECGTNQHISLGSCRVCGTKLTDAMAGDVKEPTYTCRNCGSHDIEVGNADAAIRGEKYDERR